MVDRTLRKQVIERAGDCCEYCLISSKEKNTSFHIEHIIALKHRGPTILDNLCLSCPHCNANKGSDISSVDWNTETIVPLFNPRKQEWSDHFRLNGALIEPLTPVGKVTVFLLNLNDADRLIERELMIALGVYPCRHVSES